MRLLGKIALAFLAWLAEVALSVVVFVVGFGFAIPFTALPLWLAVSAETGLAYLALWFAVVALLGAINGVCNVIKQG